LIDTLKEIFTTKELSDQEKGTFYISKKKNAVGEPLYKNITQAIEATLGKEFYIYEKRDKETLFKGKWNNYILEKESLQK